MTKPSNTESIHKATSKTWDEWVVELDGCGAQRMSHPDLASHLVGRLQDVVDNPDWWAQSIAVAYEQHTGKRLPGQLANGLFEITVSKTIHRPKEKLFHEVVEWFEKQSTLQGYSFMQTRKSETPKRSNWRCNFIDGSKFTATIENSGEKSKLVLSHTAIAKRDESVRWKQFWTGILDELAAL